MDLASIEYFNFRFKIVQVSCGYNHTACVSSEGFGFVWGDNQYG